MLYNCICTSSLVVDTAPFPLQARMTTRAGARYEEAAERMHISLAHLCMLLAACIGRARQTIERQLCPVQIIGPTFGFICGVLLAIVCWPCGVLVRRKETFSFCLSSH